MQPVTSSWIAAIGYDDVRGVYVELIDGEIYLYEQVPRVIWRALTAADSKGRFVNTVLKPYFDCRAV